MPFFRCSKILREEGMQEILQQNIPKNSRSQIVFWTEILQKLTLAAPVSIQIYREQTSKLVFERSVQ